MSVGEVAQVVTAIASACIAAVALYIAWLQYRTSLEQQEIAFSFHHAYGIPSEGTWIGITCQVPKAYIHGVHLPDRHAEGDFGTDLEHFCGVGLSRPGLVMEGDVRFVRVNKIDDDGYFYVDVVASVDKRGKRRTISSDALTDGLVH